MVPARCRSWLAICVRDALDKLFAFLAFALDLPDLMNEPRAGSTGT